jgi:hypothetical protein
LFWRSGEKLTEDLLLVRCVLLLLHAGEAELPVADAILDACVQEAGLRRRRHQYLQLPAAEIRSPDRSTDKSDNRPVR